MNPKKREHSPATKKRLAKNNAQHYHLQKQLGNELKEMTPEAFLKLADSVAGSNRELIHTLNAVKLYVSSLLDNNAQLQQQLQNGQDQQMDVNMRSDHEEDAQNGGLPRSQALDGSDSNLETGGQAILHAMGSISEVDHRKGKKGVGVWPKGKDENGTVPPTPIPDISPHDSFLRQAIEKLIALTKESVMATEGVLREEQIKRLNTVHDFIVNVIDDMRKSQEFS
jgi:hypothetical protein